MPVTPSFGISRTYETTLQRLWSVFTDGHEMAQWIFPKDAEVLKSEMFLSPGGQYLFAWALQGVSAIRGKWDIRAVDPPTSLQFRQVFVDERANECRNPVEPLWPMYVKSEFRFARQGTGATVTINATPVDASETECAAFRAAFRRMSEECERALDRLETYLARA